mmetsp:Transcript_55273/g.171799  ORF Transcript_55273/g.171799 Transcript_55273/m.171799 type:complete len:208 (+) Transcript_55273:1146-1769(+)
MGAVSRSVNGLAGGHAHRQERAAVVAALEAYDVWLSRVVPGKLHGRLHGLRAGGHEEERVQVAPLWHGLLQPAGQLQHLVMVCDVHLRMPQLVHLLVHGFTNSGVTMAQAGDADACGKVKVFFTGLGEHPGALAPLHDHVGQPPNACTDHRALRRWGAGRAAEVPAPGRGSGSRTRPSGGMVEPCPHGLRRQLAREPLVLDRGATQP